MRGSWIISNPRGVPRTHNRWVSKGKKWCSSPVDLPLGRPAIKWRVSNPVVDIIRFEIISLLPHLVRIEDLFLEPGLMTRAAIAQPA